MAPDAKRELQLRMTVVADTQAATQSLQRLAAQAQQTGAAMRGGGNPLFGGMGGPTGSTGAALGRGLGGGGAAGAGGLLGRAAGFLGPIGLGMLGLNQIGQSAAAVGRAINDPYTDNLGAGRDLFRSVVPFGSTIQGWYDDISGRNASFEMAQVGHQQRMARQQGRLDLAGFNLSNNPQQAALEARARGMAGASPILEGYADRSTAEGEKAFRDRQRMLPLERESAKLEREAAVASAQRTAANKELQGIERRQNELVRERKKLEDEVENTSGAAKQRALYRLIENEQETKAQAGLRRQAETQSAEAGRQAAQARANADMVGVRKLQTEAAGLEEDAATFRAGDRRLGMMNRFQRARAVQDLELLQQYGPEAIGQSRLQNALAIAPQTAGKIVEQFGAGTAEKAALIAKAPTEYGDAAATEKAAAGKRDEAARRDLEIEATLAKASAEAGRDLGKVVAAEITRVVEAAVREIKDQLRASKNPK